MGMKRLNFCRDGSKYTIKNPAKNRKKGADMQEKQAPEKKRFFKPVYLHDDLWSI